MTMGFPARCAAGGVLLAALSLALGCSNEQLTGTVTGTVKYNGSPLPSGSVNFHSSTGAAAQALIDESGNFKIDSPLEVGEYKVYFLPPIPEQLPPGSKPPPAPKFNVPKKFQDPGSSGVTATIKPGPNAIPIEFKD